MQSHIQLFEKYVYLRFGRPYSSLTKDGAAKIVKYKMKTKKKVSKAGQIQI